MVLELCTTELNFIRCAEFSSHDVSLRNVHPQNLPDVISDNTELGTNEIRQMHELSQPQRLNYVPQTVQNSQTMMN